MAYPTIGFVLDNNGTNADAVFQFIHDHAKFDVCDIDYFRSHYNYDAKYLEFEEFIGDGDFSYIIANAINELEGTSFIDSLYVDVEGGGFEAIICERPVYISGLTDRDRRLGRDDVNSILKKYAEILGADPTLEIYPSGYTHYEWEV